MADSLVSYLERHPEIAGQLGKAAIRAFYTSGDPRAFDASASIFFGETVNSKRVDLKL